MVLRLFLEYMLHLLVMNPGIHPHILENSTHG